VHPRRWSARRRGYLPARGARRRVANERPPDLLSGTSVGRGRPCFIRRTSRSFARSLHSFARSLRSFGRTRASFAGALRKGGREGAKGGGTLARGAGTLAKGPGTYAKRSAAHAKGSVARSERSSARREMSIARAKVRGAPREGPGAASVARRVGWLPRGCRPPACASPAEQIDIARDDFCSLRGESRIEPGMSLRGRQNDGTRRPGHSAPDGSP
jgi:hypothetical protein